ncbi:MAG: ATP-binding cassette domain-containing protein, partial [Candidatus Thioglobus sp.]
MSKSQILISTSNIKLQQNGKSILDDVSFELKKGEFITLIGPNGAGKSSLIKVLLGLIKPDSGSINRAKNVKVGYTPQRFSANEFIPISVVDFLNLNQNINDDFLLETADLTGIQLLLNSSLKDLSGGEIQRVLLTRALLGKPNLLI